MSKPGNLSRRPSGSRELLARILEQPNLLAAVQEMPATALVKLVDHVGLEDAGEIIALATTEQLKRMFDEDLWRSPRPGTDEEFQAERFASWLEVLLEAGDEFAARKLAELPEDLVTLALQKHVLVINIEELALTMAGRHENDDVLLDKALESCLCEEIGEFRIISRRHDGWDAVLSVLLALDRDHHDLLQRILERCCFLAEASIEDGGGLTDLLTSEQMLEGDVAGEREDRRAEEGFIAPSSAANFLTLARTTPIDDILTATDRDPVAKAYFRNLRARPRSASPGAHAPAAPSPSLGRAADADSLIQFLREADVLDGRRVAGLLEATSGASPAPTPFLQAMRQAQQQLPELHAQRMTELAFLANIMVAACGIEGRALRPLEASDATVAVCGLGLEHVCRDGQSLHALQVHTADKMFRLGWRLLWQEVTMPAARAIRRLLGRAHGPDVDRAVRALDSGIASGKPWLARAKLCVLESLVAPAAAAALAALADECPWLTGEASMSATDGSGKLRFIRDDRDLAQVRSFLGRLL